MVQLQQCQKQRPELLAPAGDQECLEAAVRYGADAVYLGADAYGMRAAAASFGKRKLEEAVAYAHRQGVRVYLTCNTLPRNDEISRLPEFLSWAGACGVDAFIVTDLGAMAVIREILPQAEIHISTQSGVVNYRTASELYRLGAKRVVLARELSLEEIRVIRENTPPELELEVFIHGAMCMSVSGRCLLSNYMAGRDANRGQCAQPCRWNYRLVEEKRPGQYFPIFEDDQGSYILNAKDLCMLEHLDDVVKAGAVSLKIEGRAKSAYYVSVVTNAYRIALDSLMADPGCWKPEPWLSEEVRKVSHRDYSTGFFYDVPGQRYDQGGYIRRWDVAAIVTGWAEGIAYCVQRNKFPAGAELELLEPGKRPRSLSVPALYDESGTEIPDTRRANAPFSFPCPEPLAAGAILRKPAE